MSSASLTATSINPYALLTTTSMANDYFGSQAFGTGLYNTQASSNTIQNASSNTFKNIFKSEPDNAASQLLQNYYFSKIMNSSNGTVSAAGSQDSNQTTPSYYDYLYAAQIANMFSNNIPLLFSTNTSYINNDYFANQAFSSGCSINNTNTGNSGNISYSA